MRITGTAVKLVVFWSVLAMFTVMIIVVFGQLRFDRTTGYSAVFTDAGGLRAGQFVRASGVEVGKVAAVTLSDKDSRVLVEFNVDRSLALDQGTTASIRYLNLIGDRYLELKRGTSGRRLPPGGRIPVEHTQPALDLDALIGGFRPLFQALDPNKVNSIAQSIITVFQGQGATITDILDQTAALTAALADRDKAIGEVINNLNTVLATTVKHEKEFDRTVDKLELLITGLKNRADPLAAAAAHISDAAATVAGLLGEDRPSLHGTLGHLEGIQQALINDLPTVDNVLEKLPGAFRVIGRAGGIYGDFYNFYLCDISIKVNGLQPGGPVRTIKLFGQPTGRCTPQ
ncbi:MCE family protein [Mycobacterium avium]|uniref:MCE family protein n=2 Tax=Mycobacterium avium TaxID=1764 RepID=A0A3B6X3T4_MYCAV|nr:MlaD family protein [Mycobacterium avium]APT12794.1 mammalian cell entry protein [Mycobacterium avium subsp. hominissuis]AXO21790.1 MCE family protein [Mycobacterium avium subsp. hominissuis]ETZ48002.1 mce related family protein [Mycobacterium avium MAV_120809_2495]ETZ57088.1 mce related family protein [Mycobacterium avium MAV_120809_2495]KDP03661.1 mammalian cell entry protein [Mycobacterium avium subsp. hominissuis 100]